MVTMSTVLSMIAFAAPMPYGYLWEILSATVLAVGVLLAINYPSTWRIMISNLYKNPNE